MFENENDQPKHPWPQYAERERLAFLKTQLDQWQQTGAKSGAEASLRYRLLDEITKDAVLKCSEEERIRNSNVPGWSPLAVKLHDANNLVIELCFAATSFEDNWQNREQMDFWKHAIDPVDEIKKKTYKLIRRRDVENVASQYLSQPLRGQLFDRTLVDMLIAVDLYGIADYMFYSSRFGIYPVTWPLKNLLWEFVRDNAIVIIVLGFIGLAAGAAMAENIIGDWGGWVIGICFVLWIIFTGWEVVSLLIGWGWWSNAQKLLDRMLTTYRRMGSASVISAREVLDAVKASGAAGVAWPSPLYVVLEDVIARGGRL